MAESDGAVIQKPVLRSGVRYREPAVGILIVTVFVFLAVFVVWPLGAVLKSSFIRNGDFSLSLYGELFSNTSFVVPLLNSLKLGATVAVVGTFVGYLLAYLLTMTSTPFKGGFRFLATLPMIAPPFMIALAAIMLLGRNGVLTQGIWVPLFGAESLPEIYGFWGLVAVQTITYFPTSFLLLLGVFGGMDPVLEEAAQNQGAGRFRVFRDVILPLSIPGIFSSALLLFLESLADFGNPLLLGGNFKVLSVAAFLKITGEYDTSGGAMLAILLLIPALIAFFVQKYYVSKKSYATIMGKPSSSRRRQATPWTRISLFAICALVTGVVCLFFGAVVYGSFVKIWGVSNELTFENYTLAVQQSWGALSDSLVLAAIATPITGIFGMMVAYLLVRKSFKGKSLMGVLAMLTFAVPGTVVGIGYILAFNQPPLQLTGTALIIIMLFIFRNAPVGIEAGTTAIRQIDPAIEEGSASLGGDSLVTFRSVVLPLISPAFFTGLAHSFVRCMTAISAVIFVVSGQWNLATVSILGFVENSALSRASAMCMILVVIVALVLSLIQFTLSQRGLKR